MLFVENYVYFLLAVLSIRTHNRTRQGYQFHDAPHGSYQFKVSPLLCKEHSKSDRHSVSSLIAFFLIFKKKEIRKSLNMILKKACSQAYPKSAICVQKFDDSLNSAIRTTYRISLRSSSLREPRYPLLRVVSSLIFWMSFFFVLCVTLLLLPQGKKNKNARKNTSHRATPESHCCAVCPDRGVFCSVRFSFFFFLLGKQSKRTQKEKKKKHIFVGYMMCLSCCCCFHEGSERGLWLDEMGVSHGQASVSQETESKKERKTKECRKET